MKRNVLSLLLAVLLMLAAAGCARSVKEVPAVPSSPYDAPERPELEDFTWTLAYQRDGMPAGAKKLTDFSALTGTWQGYIYHNTRGALEDEAIELLNFGVTGTEDEAYLIADWYSCTFIKALRTTDKDKDADTPFAGTWDDGALTVAAGGRTITLTVFYEADGTQYAFGTMEGSKEKGTIVGMIRP